jgi:hypothetical protein
VNWSRLRTLNKGVSMRSRECAPAGATPLPRAAKIPGRERLTYHGTVLRCTVGPAIDKPSLSPQLADEDVEGMLQEADAVLATTARLIAELELLLDEGRQLLAARDALVEQRRGMVKKLKRPLEPLQPDD